MKTESTLNPHSQKNVSAALPWIIWFLAALFYFYENIIQVSPGVMVPDLMSTFSINSAALGSLIAFFFYSYASMQIPVGVLVDHYDARFLLTAATLSCVVGCILFGTATSLPIAAAGRMLIGVGAAFAAVCSMKLAANWYPGKQFSLLVGLMVTIGMLGSMVGEKPLALLVDRIGWRHSILWLAAAGVVLAILIVCIVRHSPTHLKKANALKREESKPRTQPIWHGLRQVIACRQSWMLAIYGGLMFASTSIFGGLWGVPFLMQVHHLNRPDAAGVVSMLFFGWVIGAPLTGVLVNLVNSHKKILWTGSIGALSVILLMLYVPSLSIMTLSILLVCFGFFSSCFLPSFTLMHDLHSDGNSGAALGFMNTANMVGGAVGQPLIGILLDWTWDGTLLHHARVYSTSSYQCALLALPIMIAISLLLLPFIDEKRHSH